MSGTRGVNIRLPAELLERVKDDAHRCGLTVRQLVSQAAHAALAERLCSHAAPVAEPSAPAEGEGD